jgi:16S rRNA (guanine(966)-N(2))-methyltransferase RsmD
MRIIAGRFKGRRLTAPTWEGLRPTSDKLRETLFNILAPRIEGARLLDGFAGTGAVGIEALSRGASHVTFVERDRRAVRLIEANLAACGIEADYTSGTGDVVRIDTGDLVSVVQRYAEAAFDLVWLDPPYHLTNLRDALDAAARVLQPDGLLVLERATRQEPDVPPSLQRTRDVKSGDSTLTFFTRARDGSHSVAPAPQAPDR